MHFWKDHSPNTLSLIDLKFAENRARSAWIGLKATCSYILLYVFVYLCFFVAGIFFRECVCVTLFCVYVYRSYCAIHRDRHTVISICHTHIIPFKMSSLKFATLHQISSQTDWKGVSILPRNNWFPKVITYSLMGNRKSRIIIISYWPLKKKKKEIKRNK